MEEKSKIIFSTPISLEKDVKRCEKKELYTAKDFKEMSESTLKAANDIEDIIIVYFKNNPNKFMASQGVNAYIFFAIELYFKSILYKEEILPINRKKGHDLYALFSSIGSETKEIIKKLCYLYSPYKNYVDFNNELKHIKDGFEILRYHYEYKGLCYNFSFSIGLLMAVKEVANKQVQK